MYELKRNKLVDLAVQMNGEKIPVVLDIGKQGTDFNHRYSALVNAEIELKTVLQNFNAGSATTEELEQAQATYGDGVVAVINLLFGKAGAEKIFAYFDNDYTDLLLAIIPFVRDEVVPALKAARTERLEQYTKAVKRPGFFKRR